MVKLFRVPNNYPALKIFLEESYPVTWDQQAKELELRDSSIIT